LQNYGALALKDHKTNMRTAKFNSTFRLFECTDIRLFHLTVELNQNFSPELECFTVWVTSLSMYILV